MKSGKNSGNFLKNLFYMVILDQISFLSNVIFWQLLITKSND